MFIGFALLYLRQSAAFPPKTEQLLAAQPL
jgi:hypothetical protein